MPSSTTKQAKVMSAIAHGWHPDRGSVAKIPVKVAKELHAADAGHKYGKGGKKKAIGGPVDKAMHIVRKYAKKADGGADLSPDEAPKESPDLMPPDQAAMSPETFANPYVKHVMDNMGHLISAPGKIRTPNPYEEGTEQWYAYENMRQQAMDEVAPELAAAMVGGSEVAPIPRNAIGSGLGSKLSVSGNKRLYISSNKNMTAKGAEIADQIHGHVLDASEAVSPEIAKNIKQYYPKDIAASAGYLGIQPEGIENLKSNMSPGAADAFDKHFGKMFGAPEKVSTPPPSAAEYAAAAKKPIGQLTPEDFEVLKNPPKDPTDAALQAIQEVLKASPEEWGWHPHEQKPWHPEMEGSDLPADNAHHMELFHSKDWRDQPPEGPEGWGQDLYHTQEESPEAGITSAQFHWDSHLNDPKAKWPEYDALHDKYVSEPLNLTKQEKEAVGYWGSKDGYKAINGQLRGTHPPTEAADAAIEDLHSAMVSSPLKENTSVWRGLYGPQGKALKNLDVGDTFHNAGFTATSVDPRQATHYGAKDQTYYKQKDAPGILINYHLPAGQPSLYVSHPDAGNWMQAERELLLPHSDSYKIIGKDTIKAPVWHRLGDVTDPNLHEYTVYHVAPTFEKNAGTRLDAAPNAGLVDKNAEAENAIQAIKEAIAKVPQQKPLEEAIPEALKNKYGDTPLDSIPTNFASKLLAKFESIKHNIWAMPQKDILKTLGSVHVADSPISMHGIYGQQLGKYLKKTNTNELLSNLSDLNLTKEQWKNLLSHFPEEKIADIRYELGIGVEKSPFSDMVDQHLKMVNWKDYKPVSADPVPEEIKPLQKKIAAAGANPNVILLKGGSKEYPKELMDATKKMSSSTKGLFLGDQADVAKAYGSGIPVPYVARPQKPVAVLDFHELLSAMNDLHWGTIAPAYGPNFIRAIQHIRNKYDPDMLVMHNVYDWAGSGSKPATQYIVFKTNILRAPHAKFDPKKFHLRVPLAGIAGMAGAAGIYSYGNEPAQAAEGKAGGGKVKHKQIDEDPQDHEFINFSKGGLIDSDIPGRTDKIPMKVRAGAYVLPADIPSALGEGNSKAGATILKKMFTHSAYGLPPPHIHSTTQHTQWLHPMHTSKHARGGKVAAEKVLPANHRLGMKVPKGGSMCANCHFLKEGNNCGNKGFQQWNGGPKLPEPANEYCCDLYEHVAKKADGGPADGGEDHVPIITAGGEFVIHPDVVKHIGHGSMQNGHKVLDKFVVNTRKQHIETLKKLKPPK